MPDSGLCHRYSTLFTPLTPREQSPPQNRGTGQRTAMQGCGGHMHRCGGRSCATQHTLHSKTAHTLNTTLRKRTETHESNAQGEGRGQGRVFEMCVPRINQATLCVKHVLSASTHTSVGIMEWMRYIFLTP